ncbi:MAG: Hemin transport system permease protein HmuU [Pseudomonadota bacterium]
MTRSYVLWTGGLCVFSAVLLSVGCGVGSQGWEVTFIEWDDPVARQIFWDIRLPRNVGAWMGGALLGLSGAIAQGLFRNPLADPYLMGSSSGASLGVGLYLTAWGSSLMEMANWERLGITGAAFVGAVVAVCLTLLLSRGTQHTLRLLLAGVVVGVVLGALATLVVMREPNLWQTLQAFMLGSVTQMDASACAILGFVLLICLLSASYGARVLDALHLGEDTARSLGMPLTSARWGLLSVMSLATGSSVAQMGLVAFIGLAAPHAVRSTVRAPYVWLLVLSALMGGVLLLASDILARLLWAPEELPVGVLTAILGGGYLLWRMHRSPQGAA